MVALGGITNKRRPSSLTTMSLQKLNLPQLKALCKEKKIIGYSKLNKDALVQKILASGVAIEESSLAQGTGTPEAPQSFSPHAPSLHT